MNSYEEKLERKRERYSNLADKNRSERDSLHHTNQGILDAMNGQPILIGHHSEKRHRRELQKVDNRMRKAIQCDDKSKYYERRANNVGSGGISSDDPEALVKLKGKLADLERSQEFMKKVNAQFRKGGIDAVECSEYVKSAMVASMAADWRESPKPFESYRLTNNNATIRATRKRIEQMEAIQQMESEDISSENFTFSHDKEDNRFLFEFPGKPDEETRNVIKSFGFKWSRYRTAWVRKVTANAVWSKDQLIKKLTGMQIQFS